MHLIAYNIFLFTYRISVSLMARWNPKARRWVEGRKNIFEKIASGLANNKSNVIWMHCASLGEFEQGRPILEELRKLYTGHIIVLTFFSPSGYEVKKNYPNADHIFYLPADSKKNAVRLLELVKPKLVLWVKYDYWYYYLSEIKERDIPLLLVSGFFNKQQAFFKWYGRLYRNMLNCFTHLFVQTAECKLLLGKLGFTDNVTVSGDTRFDRVLQIAEQFEPVPGIEEFCGHHPVIVAGSTWEEDEEELDHYANTHPEIKFIIAPHEIDEEHLKRIEKLFKYTVRYSELQNTSYQLPETGNPKPETVNVLIIDNIGMLSRLYKYATIAYIGGGFRESGVHNVLEAAVYSKPVVFGTDYDLYVEAIELIDEEGAFSIESAIEMEKLFNDLLSNEQLYKESSEAAGKYVRSKRGATVKIMRYIQAKRLLTSL